MDGGVGIFGFADIDRFFGFGVLLGLRVLSLNFCQLKRWPRFFGLFYPMMHVMVFLVLPCQGSTPCSRAKIVIPRDHLYQEPYIAF